MLLNELKAGDWFRWNEQTWMLLDHHPASMLDCVLLNGESRGMIVVVESETEVKRIDDDRKATLITRQTESDNSWHERGELPPVGTVCEYSLDELGWHECHIRYVLDNDPAPDSDGWKAVAWCPHLEKEQIATHYWKFRPIKTDRERTIEAAQEILSTGFLKADLEALYDSGLLRMPEGE